MGGPGAHPARCWAQTNPGRARCGPRGSGPASPPGRGIVGPSSSPPGPPEAPPPRRREMGTQKGNKLGWDPAPRCRRRYRHPGDAPRTEHGRAPGEAPPAADRPAARQVSAWAALSVTPSGQPAAWRWGGGRPRPFLSFLYFQAEH